MNDGTRLFDRMMEHNCLNGCWNWIVRVVGGTWLFEWLLELDCLNGWWNKIVLILGWKLIV